MTAHVSSNNRIVRLVLITTQSGPQLWIHHFYHVWVSQGESHSFGPGLVILVLSNSFSPAESVFLRYGCLHSTILCLFSRKVTTFSLFRQMIRRKCFSLCQYVKNRLSRVGSDFSIFQFFNFFTAQNAKRRCVKNEGSALRAVIEFYSPKGRLNFYFDTPSKNKIRVNLCNSWSQS